MMAAATKTEISEWFDRGIETGMAYMLVVCDRFDHEDYPVYAENDEQAFKANREHNGPNMQKVMEVYDLRLDKQTQLNEFRAFHLPAIKY